MVYVRINELLKKKKKSKYWFVKNMESSYQCISNLINNKTAGIKFETLERACIILECNINDIIVLKNNGKKGKKNEQTSKAV